MHAPIVHGHRIELRSHARFEYSIAQTLWHAIAIVGHDNAPRRARPRRSHDDRSGMGVTRIAEHFDNCIFDAANVLLRLAALGFRHAQANEAIAQIVFNAKPCTSGQRVEKRGKLFRFGHSGPLVPYKKRRRYGASSTFEIISRSRRRGFRG